MSKKGVSPSVGPVNLSCNSVYPKLSAMEESSGLVSPGNQSEHVPAPVAADLLQDASKWARFLGITGMATGVICVISTLGIFIAQRWDPYIESFVLHLAITLSFFAVINMFPSWYLFRFASRIQSYSTDSDQSDMAPTMEYLFRYFKFSGMRAAILIGLLILILFFSLAGWLLG